MSARHRHAKQRLGTTRWLACGLERLLEAYNLVISDLDADEGNNTRSHLVQLRESVVHRLADVSAAITEQEALVAAMPKRLEDNGDERKKH